MRICYWNRVSSNENSDSIQHVKKNPLTPSASYAKIPVFESLMVKHGAKLQIKIYSLAFFSLVNPIKNRMLMAGLLMQKIL